MPRLRSLVLALALMPVAAAGVGSAQDAPRVAVLDSGIRADHPEFRSGQVVAWRDFVASAAEPYDDSGHGTAVAGRVAGARTGAYQAADLIVAKVIDATNRATWDRIVSAMDWAVGEGADVISVSIWTSLPNAFAAQQVAKAIARATQAGVLVVWIAGNGGDLDVQDGDAPVPSTLLPGGGSAQVLVVGAADAAGTRAGFSQHEPNVLAHGAGVTVARMTGYADANGTSYAAPYVAGIAAAMLHAGAPRDPDRLAWSLRHIARDDPSVSYLDEGYGFLGPDDIARAIDIGAGREAAPPLDERDAFHRAFLAARAPQSAGIPLGLLPPV